MIIFGFYDDPNGYFALGVIGDSLEEDKYATHGAGYWNWIDNQEKSEVEEQQYKCFYEE